MNIANILRSRKAGQFSPGRSLNYIIDSEHRSLHLSESVEFIQDSHTASVTSIALDNDAEQYVLAGLGDGTLLIHNVRGEAKKDRFGFVSKVEWRAGKIHPGRHKHGIKTVSWFTDNGIFFTSGRDGKLKVWDTNAGSVVEEFKIGEAINHHCLASSELGPLIAVASKSRNVVLADMSTGSACHTLRGHTGEVYSLSWSPANPRILASGSQDKKVMLWDVRQAKSYLATLDYNNVRFKRSKDLKLSGESHQGGVHGLHFSPCGRYIYTLGSDKRIRKWDAVTMKNLKLKFPEVDTKHDGNTVIQSVVAGNTDLLFVPEQNLITYFNCTTGNTVCSLAGHYSTVYTLAYSGRDCVLYSGARDRFILQWDTPLRIAASRATKIDEEESRETKKSLQQFTVDTWSSDEEENND